MKFGRTNFESRVVNSLIWSRGLCMKE